MKNITPNWGYNYEDFDPFKIACQKAGLATAQNLNRFGFREVTESRGESCYLIETPDSFLAFLVEGLGTKNMAADIMYEATGKSYYDQIAICALATMFNDMATTGADPFAVQMHLASGDSKWFVPENKRPSDLILGWVNGCNMVGATWGGGETQALKKMQDSETAVISGAVLGIIKPKEYRIRERICDGDRIVILFSSGIHANALTMARKVGVYHGYLQPMSSGRIYGDALLTETILYGPIVRAMLDEGIEIHYALNITGHGWRKLMRAQAPFEYIVEKLPPVHPEFEVIQQYANISDYEAYSQMNMGGGFALYIPEKDADRAVAISEQKGVGAINAGFIRATKGQRSVHIVPKDIRFDGQTLDIRA